MKRKLIISTVVIVVLLVVTWVFWKPIVLTKIQLDCLTAVRHFQKGEYSRSEKILERVKHLVEKYEDLKTKSFYSLGFCYFQVERYEEAEKELRATCEADPTNASAHSMLGLTQRRLKHYDDAIASLKSAVSLRGDADDYYNLDTIYADIGEYQTSVKLYRKALDIDSSLADAYGALSISYNRLNESEKAKKCLEKAFEIDPNFKLNLLEE